MVEEPLFLCQLAEQDAVKKSEARQALAQMGGGVGWLTAGARTGSTTWLTSKKSKVPVARCARRDIVSTRGTS